MKKILVLILLIMLVGCKKEKDEEPTSKREPRVDIVYHLDDDVIDAIQNDNQGNTIEFITIDQNHILFTTSNHAYIYNLIENNTTQLLSVTFDDLSRILYVDLENETYIFNNRESIELRTYEGEVLNSISGEEYRIIHGDVVYGKLFVTLYPNDVYAVSTGKIYNLDLELISSGYESFRPVINSQTNEIFALYNVTDTGERYDVQLYNIETGEFDSIGGDISNEQHINLHFYDNSVILTEGNGTSIVKIYRLENGNISEILQVNDRPVGEYESTTSNTELLESFIFTTKKVGSEYVCAMHTYKGEEIAMVTTPEFCHYSGNNSVFNQFGNSITEYNFNGETIFEYTSDNEGYPNLMYVGNIRVVNDRGLIDASNDDYEDILYLNPMYEGLLIGYVAYEDKLIVIDSNYNEHLITNDELLSKLYHNLTAVHSGKLLITVKENGIDYLYQYNIEGDLIIEGEFIARSQNHMYYKDFYSVLVKTGDGEYTQVYLIQ